LKNKIIKIIKIALGSTIAILIAYLLNLQYAVAAGVIVLLSIQDTKKATLQMAIKRVLAFIVTCAIAYIVFLLFSFTPIAYGIYLLIFSFFCIFFKMQDALAMNAVLATHFLLEQTMGWTIILNEAFLLLIGAGIGILLNLYIPNNVKQIRKTQETIERCLKSVLTELAQRIEQTEKIDEPKVCNSMLKKHIKEGMEHAYVNMHNTFFQDSRYFIKYMGMRKQQSYVLKEMYEKAETLTMVTIQSLAIADFIRVVEETLSESNNTERLLVDEKLLMERCQNDLLPVTREEFETRAILYILLMNFRMFLTIKKDFVESLSEGQKRKFWKVE
jgi:uncharacterized membrane protein YgaE (UPF0421/DUF939 family)